MRKDCPLVEIKKYNDPIKTCIELKRQFPANSDIGMMVMCVDAHTSGEKMYRIRKPLKSRKRIPTMVFI